MLLVACARSETATNKRFSYTICQLKCSGEIHRLRCGGRRINLLYSKKDVMRSGYLHNHKTFSFVVKGKVEVWMLKQEGTEKTVYGQNEFFTVDSWFPHILHFLSDTIIVEFWEGHFQCWYYHPYRRLVQLQNELVANCGNKDEASSSIGQFQRLVPADLGDATKTTTAGALFWMGTGIVVGAFAATTLLALAAGAKRK